MNQSSEKTWVNSRIESLTNWRKSEGYSLRIRRRWWKRSRDEDVEWISVEYDHKHHLFPPGDFVAHDAHEDADDTCICGPEVIFGNGSVVYVHHSLDGREFRSSGFTKHREVC